MSSDIADILDEFVVESQEQLSEVESLLMELEVGRAAGEPLDSATVDTVFRAFHSVKGTAGFLDLDNIVAVTHEAETILDHVRRGTIQLTGEHITALCTALDFTSDALKAVQSCASDAEVAPAVPGLVATLRGALGHGSPEPAAPAAAPAPAAPAPAAPEEHQPGPTSPMASIPLFDGEFDAVPPEPATEAVDETGLVYFADEDAEDSVEDAPDDMHDAFAEPAGADPQATMDSAQAVPPPNAAAPSAEPDTARVPAKRKVNGQESQSLGTIRVDVEKLDSLMNLVGELILAETMVTHNEDLDGVPLQNFRKAARDLNRITRSLQDIAMSVRMVPIRGTFQKMRRLVRDLSRKQNKRVELVITGEQTEVDKNLIESIADPLVHIMRNSVDHGLETPEDREAAGKSPVGKVYLEARHQSGEVWIQVRDNGRGLNRDKIAAKAISRGLIHSADGMSDSDIYNLIFAPGFSTADTISDVSGRGVGMDVVKRNIEKVKGRVDVTSRPGHGTTLTLRIPLTLAIIDGMVIRVGQQRYTLPLLAIQESLPGRKELRTVLPDGSETVTLRGRVLPLIRLADALGMHTDTTLETGILVVCAHAERTVCLLVDELLGQRQTVIKGLPDYMGQGRGFSGCSILSNGDISLIIDLGAIVGSVSHRRAA